MLHLQNVLEDLTEAGEQYCFHLAVDSQVAVRDPRWFAPGLPASKGASGDIILGLLTHCLAWPVQRISPDHDLTHVNIKLGQMFPDSGTSSGMGQGTEWHACIRSSGRKKWKGSKVWVQGCWLVVLTKTSCGQLKENGRDSKCSYIGNKAMGIKPSPFRPARAGPTQPIPDWSSRNIMLPSPEV